MQGLKSLSINKQKWRYLVELLLYTYIRNIYFLNIEVSVKIQFWNIKIYVYVNIRFLEIYADHDTPWLGTLVVWINMPLSVG